MVFLFILIGIGIFSIVLIFSKIQIQIVNLKFSSEKPRHINSNYQIIIKLLIFKKIPVFKVSITKNKLEKVKLKEKVQQVNWQKLQSTNLEKDALKAIKELKLDVKNINLNIELGTENACFTSILVPAISTAISIWLGRKIKNYENQIFIIKPVYLNQNFVNILISGIFEVKMKHIISMLYVLNEKEGVRKYERTSNRRAYDYSYE